MVFNRNKADNLSEYHISDKRNDFELFKSNVCHNLKRLGDIDFIRQNLIQDKIREYFIRDMLPESFYLLAMLDYISNQNNINLCDRYNDLRKMTLDTTIYPKSILMWAAISEDETIKEKAKKESIPEFMHFNIVESDIRNVI